MTEQFKRKDDEKVRAHLEGIFRTFRLRNGGRYVIKRPEDRRHCCGETSLEITKPSKIEILAALKAGWQVRPIYAEHTMHDHNRSHNVQLVLYNYCRQHGDVVRARMEVWILDYEIEEELVRRNPRCVEFIPTLSPRALKLAAEINEDVESDLTLDDE